MNQLEALKRQWLTSNSVEDHANYLREQIRLQILTQSQVELAAYCGHEAAQIATSHSIKPASSYQFLQQKLYCLENWSPLILTQAVFIATHAVLDHPSTIHSSHRDTLLSTLECAEKWRRTGQLINQPEIERSVELPQPEDWEAIDALEPDTEFDLLYLAEMILSEPNSQGEYDIDSACKVIINISDLLEDKTWPVISQGLIEFALKKCDATSDL